MGAFFRDIKCRVGDVKHGMCRFVNMSKERLTRGLVEWVRGVSWSALYMFGMICKMMPKASLLHRACCKREQRKAGLIYLRASLFCRSVLMRPA